MRLDILIIILPRSFASLRKGLTTLHILSSIFIVSLMYCVVMIINGNDVKLNVQLQDKKFRGSELISYPLDIDLLAVVRQIRLGGRPPVSRINSVNTSWFISCSDLCSHSPKPQLLLIIKSGAGNADLRDSIRHTWGDPNHWKSQDLQVKSVFMLARSQSAVVENEVMQESGRHGDLVVGNFIDNYYNNTLKLMNSVRWQQKFCNLSSRKLILFVDDDFVLNPVTLAPYLRSVMNSPAMTRLFAGRLRLYETPSRPWKFPFTIFNDKWRVDWSEYGSEWYPPFLPAGFMLFGADLLSDVSIAMEFVKWYPFDDIFMALVVHKLLVQPLHINRIYTQPNLIPNIKSEKFKYSRAVHGFKTSKEMKRAWKYLNV